ncbi:MAG: deoxyribonuclease IV [Bacteroidota bacterium]|nr:deoxyribonuclease IV [Bacteroidota bacterium]MDP4234136.1 deoxyribonuclease IV [Bacteroidota bacterium]MDP4244073.1 deoxyribonuclease IV [Bacteroidota bacterium]MDP4289227.1 deoxyribonuclease IV [Bacteroidota bacterium]
MAKKHLDSSEPLLGVHVSTAGGLVTAFERAEKLGINTFQLFVKNNKQWFAPAELSTEEINAFHARRKAWKQKGPLVAHACYLLNLGSSNPEIQETSRKSYLQELTRANALGVDHFVFHPGSHNSHGEESAIGNIATALDWIHERTVGFTTKSVLEITAGQGSSVGNRFEHLEQIIARVEQPERVAVCLDTCHLFAAGYDLRDQEVWDKTFAEFESRIGFDKLVCIHTNDSKKGLASRVDRHEHIGKGTIGIEAFRLLMNDKRFKLVPKILETPKDEKMTEDYTNLALLRGLIGKS